MNNSFLQPEDEEDPEDDDPDDNKDKPKDDDKDDDKDKDKDKDKKKEDKKGDPQQQPMDVEDAGIAAFANSGPISQTSITKYKLELPSSLWIARKFVTTLVRQDEFFTIHGDDSQQPVYIDHQVTLRMPHYLMAGSLNNYGDDIRWGRIVYLKLHLWIESFAYDNHNEHLDNKLLILSMNREVDLTNWVDPLKSIGGVLMTIPNVAQVSKATTYYKDITFLIKRPKFHNRAIRSHIGRTGHGMLLDLNDGNTNIAIEGVNINFELWAPHERNQGVRLHLLWKWEGIVEALRLN